MGKNINSIVYKIDLDSPIPRYHQIKEHLRGVIENNQLQPGDAFPSEKEMAASYGVNRLTVRQAITELVTEGLFVRRHGVGIFVAEPKITQSHTQLLGFTQRMAQLSRKARGQILEAIEMPASEYIARHLEIPVGEATFKIVRLRLADDRPVMIETSYLAASICPTLLDVNLTESLYDILVRSYGITLSKADQYLEPILLDDWEADLLGVETGSPALLIETIVRAEDDTVVEFSKGILRGNTSRVYFHVTSNNVF